MRSTRLSSGPLLIVLLAGLWGCTTTTTTTSNGASSGSSGASSGGGAGGGGIDPSKVTALPQTAFVFVKHVRANADHIYSFDVATGKESLVTKLKDDGTNGTTLAGSSIALSHDRKQIAFAAIYDVVPADANTPGDAQAIWSVSVDGQSFARLSSTIAPPTGIDCSHSTCTDTMFCGASHVCLMKGYNVDKREPAFSPDDKTVSFTFGTFWTGFDGKLSGGSVIATVPVTGGLPSLGKPIDAACAVTSGPSISPDGAKMATFTGVCSGKPNTISLVHEPATVEATYPATETNPRIVWAPDGSAFYYLLRPNNGQLGVAMQPVNGGAPVQLVNPTDGVSDVVGLALSPDGQTMIGAVSTDGGKTCDLASLTNFTGSGQPQATELTKDGKSCDPAWR